MRVKALKTHKKNRAEVQSDERKGGFLLALVKGVVVGLCVALLGILIFAFLLRFTSIPDTIIAPVNQVIKGVSIFFGVFIGMKKHKSMGLLSGLLIGLLFTIFAFLVFSILNGAFAFDRTLVNDIIFGCVIGAICGIICVNLKKN